MAIACVNTRASCGVEAPEVTVEVHLSNGLPAFNLVGLPEASVKEARERVRSALINAGFEFPMRRITVNLLMLLTLTLAFSANADLFRVIDGDTFKWLKNLNETPVRARLDSIDCPEMDQPWGNEASIALADYLNNEPTVTTINVDHYQRPIVVIYVGNTNANLQLVKDGHCWCYSKYATDPAYSEAQKKAQTDKLGLWKNDAIAPWIWRKR